MKIPTRATKIKVLHIGLDTGGVRTYLGHVFDYCNLNDFEFVVVAPENELFRNYCQKKDIKYYPVNLLRGGNIFIAISSLIAIIRIILTEKPDIIHTHSAKAGFLGRLAAKLTASKNVIFSPHAFSYLSFSGIKRIIFYTLEIIARGWTSVLLAIAYSEVDRSIHELGYERNAVKLILNAIPVPKEMNDKRNGRIFNIRMIGRLTIQKNPMLFLEIAKTITDKYDFVRFSILGGGIHDHLANEINDYISENNLRGLVNIEGWADEQKSKTFLEEADIYVMTSIFEGLPYSLLEAMAMGKPCVVSEVDGNKDVIHNYENGFTCITKDDFCEKIELLINNENLRKEMGSTAFSYVEHHHNILDNIKQLEQLYYEMGNVPLIKHKRPVVVNVSRPPGIQLDTQY